MGDTGPEQTERFVGEQLLADVFKRALQGHAPVTTRGLAGLNLGQLLQQQLSLPQFQGGRRLTAPATGAQQQALGGLEQVFALANQQLPGLLSNVTGGLQGLSQGTGQAGQALASLATGQAGPAQGLVEAFAALDQARQAGLQRDLGNIREQFSTGGLRQSTDLARALGARQAESEASFLGQTAPLAAQVAQQQAATQLGAAQSLGQQQLGALLGLPGVVAQTLGIPQTVGGELFRLGEATRQISDQDILRRMQEFQRTQAALFQPALSFFSGTPQIVPPGIGDTLLGGLPLVGAAALTGGK